MYFVRAGFKNKRTKIIYLRKNVQLDLVSLELKDTFSKKKLFGSFLSPDYKKA